MLQAFLLVKLIGHNGSGDPDPLFCYSAIKLRLLGGFPRVYKPLLLVNFSLCVLPFSSCPIFCHLL